MSVEVAEPLPGVMLVGAKTAVAPGGKPVTVKSMGLLKAPPTEAAVMVNVVDAPFATVCEGGVIGVDDEVARGGKRNHVAGNGAGGRAGCVNCEDYRVARCATRCSERDGEAGGVSDGRRGLGEVDDLRSQRDDNSFLHLRSGCVVCVACLVGIDNDAAHPGYGKR